MNPQLLGARGDIPVHYDAGAYTETDRVVNFDFSKPMDMGFHGPVNIALGLEYRDETSRADIGDPDSFHINTEYDLAAQGFGIGSNGFPGFRPSDAGESTAGARGALSTGFLRVPTAGQANLRNVTTEFNQGMMADIATLPPTNPVAAQKGTRPLTPETSVDLTLGAVLGLDRVDLTVDYYAIEIQDRIAFTSRFNLTETDIAALLGIGVIDARSFTSVRYLSNKQTLKTAGVDLVASLPFEFAGGSSTITAVANWSEVELTRFSPRYTTETRRLQIERGRPDARYVVTWTHVVVGWRLTARSRYYGEYYDAPTNDGSVAFYAASDWLFDVEAEVPVGRAVSLVLGSENVLDNYPSENPHGEVAGLIYPETSPFGFNGAFHYARLRWRM